MSDEIVNIVEIKAQAITYLTKAKKKKKLTQLAKTLEFDPSWVYKVINGLVKPSLERCLLVLEHEKENPL